MVASGLPWVLTADGPDGLRAAAARLGAEVAAAEGDSLPDLVCRAADDATPLSHRAVVFGDRREEVAAALERVARGDHGGGVVSGIAPERARVAFVFSPLRAEYPGMCVGLAERYPPFGEALAACARELEPLTGWSLDDVLRGREGTPPLKRLDVGQPLLFAVSWALAELWRALGVRPFAVLGHSVGEIAAAAACGALSLADAAQVAATWGRSSMRLEGTGTMLSVPLGAAEVEERLRRWDGRLAISGLNSPTWTAVSGETAAAEELLEELERDGVAGRSMGIEAPGHSAGMAPIDEWFSAELAAIEPRSSTARFYSATEGRPIGSRELDAAYWSRNLRVPVRFEAAIRRLRADGHDAIVEIGPRPVLTAAIEETLAGEGAAVGGWEQGDADQLPLQLAAAYVRGVEVSWSALCRMGRPAGGRQDASLRSRLRALPPAERRPLLVALLRREVGRLGGDLEGDLAESTAFRDLGLDSRAALALRNRLSAATGIELAKTAVFDHPTIGALATHLSDPHKPRRQGPRGEPPPARDPSTEIAVVGIGCRFPGGVDSAAGLWGLVAEGREAVGDFPEDRGWDLERLFDPDPGRPGTTHVRRGGFLRDLAEFDAAFFGIGPREARAMDPQQRLALEVAWEAIETAGIDATGLAGESVGVFAGAFASAYGPSIRAAGGGAAGHLLTGTAPSVIAGRVAYALGLQGPALTVDTACSSSLVAIHLACRALRSGECDMALAGGVTALSTPDLFVEFSVQRALAPDGRCKSFAEGADGTAWAEGAGLLLLEPLAQARRDGRPVLAVLRGSAVNQDGASNGLTAPSGPAQERVIRQALADAGLPPSAVDAVEAHGTGTSLGDPIEAGALLAAYGEERDGPPLRLGSIKSNIGHCSAAAGVAGTIKMAMALRHGALPKTLHAERPSSAIDWAAGKLELLQEQVPWQPVAGRPRRAAVSSFGISGTNAHLVLEEPPARQPRRPEPSPAAPHTFPLSAKSDAALRAQAARLAEHLRANPREALADVAFTLARRARLARRAVVVGGRPELLAGLAALSSNEEASGLVRGDTEPDEKARAEVGPAGGHLLDLPTYPFQRQRYWLDHDDRAVAVAGSDPVEHPLLATAMVPADQDRLLLGGKVSLRAQPWLADHASPDAALLPATAFVDLALAAGRRVGRETLAELTLEAPLPLPAQGEVPIQVVVGAERPDSGREVAIYSRPVDRSWMRHACGALAASRPPAAGSPPRWPPDAADPIDVDLLHERLASRGMRYGPCFRGLRRAWRGDDEVFAEVGLAEGESGDGFVLHPALADAALHPAFELDRSPGAADGAPLPFSWSDVRVGPGAPPDSLRVRIAADRNGGVGLSCFREDGSPALSVGVLRMQRRAS